MKSFLKYTLATIAGIFVWSFVTLLVTFGIIGAISSISGDKTVTIKPNTVLVMKLDQQIVDRAGNNPLENFSFTSLDSQQPLGLTQIIDNLKKAKDDENIKGIYLDLTHTPAGFATIDDIRQAIIDFKQSGKFVYVYSEYLTQKTYYLATAADKIYMNPVGEMEIKGLSSRITFYKNTLEKLGIEPVIFRHGKYKSAIEPFIYDKMSDDNKLQTITYVQSIWDYMANNIAQARNLTAQRVNEIADKFLVRNTKDAVELNIIDGVKYKDEMLDELVLATGAKNVDELETVSIGKYFNVNPNVKAKKDKRQKIAVIYASGEIEMGKGESQVIGSETISKAIRKARTDSTVKAIVLRVNSPGGSALASDIIWREAVLAKKVKPFVVSMGDYAASGGYYIACPADVIVASPATLTGSIGVFGLMFNTQKFMNQKIGLTFDGVKTNKFADMPNNNRPFTAEEKDIIQNSVEDIYTEFINHVAQGRNMTTSAVDSIGQGRVWSGINAKQIGLVDEFGGLNKAIEIAAQKAGIDDYKTIELPEMSDPMEEFIKQLTGQVKMRIIKAELGVNYIYYQQLNHINKLQGKQARVPYDIELY